MLRSTLPLLPCVAMLALIGCGTPDDKVDDTSTPADEMCDNDADDDGDGDVDCDDDDCADDAACAAPTTETACDDGADDDGDGATDCDDSDCAADPACATPSTETACDDGADDDGDGATDCDDTDCAADPACELPLIESDCADGVDEDGDGTTDCDDLDCVADAVCLPTSETACTDTLDDDADGLIDCADDDCAGDAACIPTEETNCTDGVDEDLDERTDCDDRDCEEDPACIESSCADGLDDDGDGLVDCADADCGDAAECEVCYDGDLSSTMGLSVATGSTVSAGDDWTATCGSSASEDVAYRWVAPADGTYIFSLDGSGYDTVLTIQEPSCSGLEVDCDDDSGEGTASQLTYTATAGQELYLVVEGYSSGSGDYVLNILSETEGTCDDGADADGDGLTDCDDDDCASAAVCNPETTCDDGLDDDTDGLTDCDDTDCASAFACVYTCADEDLGSVVGASIASGSTAGLGDAHAASCGGSGGDDIGWKWTAPADGTYTFDTSGTAFDAVLSLEEDLCTGVELDCVDAATAGGSPSSTVTLTSGEVVMLFVDGLGGASGDYVVNVWTTAEVDCDDGEDEDVDGLTDCDDTDDCSAAPACNPETVCDDVADDEGDGLTDCLDTDDCSSDPACDTSLADYELGSTSGTAVVTGDTTGAVNDRTPSCGYSNADDILYAWVAPSTGTWTFDLASSSYDTVLEILDTDGAALGCDDDSSTGTTSMVSVSLNAGQLVFVNVDGYSSNSGPFQLDIY